MLKIILKSIILVCIILSIYFIVNPSACSNLINGRAVNSREEMPVISPDDRHDELFTPTGDQPLRSADKPAKTTPADGQTKQPQTVAAAQQTPGDATPKTAAQNTPVAGIVDTNSMQAAKPKQLSQAEKDYAIASRYVELENQYLAQHKDSKNAAKDIAYIVMDDFELTPTEWEEFLKRATAANLFEQIRQEKK